MPHVFSKAGEVTQGLATVDETRAHCKTRDEGWYVAELLRIKGELLLKDAGDRSTPTAEDCVREALEVAREQRAMFWELRTATSLARLWRDQKRVMEARELLAKVCAFFTEGFGTVGLKEAKKLVRATGVAGGLTGSAAVRRAASE